MKIYCPAGHNTTEVGRYRDGKCKACQRARARAYARGLAASKRRVPLPVFLTRFVGRLSRGPRYWRAYRAGHQAARRRGS